jgi:hypothetical protein
VTGGLDCCSAFESCLPNKSPKPLVV